MAESIQVQELRPWPNKPRRFSIEKMTNVFDLRIGQILQLNELSDLRNKGINVIIRRPS